MHPFVLKDSSERRLVAVGMHAQFINMRCR